MDPYLIIKFGNQHYQSSIKTKRGKDVEYNEKVTFIVNSCYQKMGRVLEVEVWDQDKIGKSEIGFGVLDLTQIVDKQK